MEYQLIVLELERSPIYSFKRMLENELIKLKALGEEFDLKVGVVINKVWEAKGDLDEVVDFIEDVVKAPVLGVLSFDSNVPLASNYGTPVLAKFPRTQASKDLLELGENLITWIFGKKHHKKSKWGEYGHSIWEALHGIIHWS